MSEDIFSQTEGDNSESVVDKLVGEGKKFKTVEDLAKSKLEADSFIEQLQNENKLTREQMAELEEKATKQGTLQELVDAVKNANTQGSEEGNQPISEDDLSKKIEEVLGKKTVEQTREANYKEAYQAVLHKVNGDVEAAKSFVAERSKQLGMSPDRLKALGEESPQAFKKLMQLDQSTGSPSVNTLSGNRPPPNTETVVDGHRTKAYYDALKKELGPAKYWRDSKLQAQYTKDAMALGDRFNQ